MSNKYFMKRVMLVFIQTSSEGNALWNLGTISEKIDHENGLFWWTYTIFSSVWEKYFCWVCMIRTSLLYGISAHAAFLAENWNMSGWFSELLLLSGAIALGLSHVIAIPFAIPFRSEKITTCSKAPRNSEYLLALSWWLQFMEQTEEENVALGYTQ